VVDRVLPRYDRVGSIPNELPDIVIKRCLVNLSPAVALNNPE